MARSDWKPRPGTCTVCGTRQRVIFHHIVTRTHVKREHGDEWDFRNALPVGAPYVMGGRCRCHENHHAAIHRIPLAVIPATALAFAAELYGETKAAMYFERMYGA